MNRIVVLIFLLLVANSIYSQSDSLSVLCNDDSLQTDESLTPLNLVKTLWTTIGSHKLDCAQSYYLGQYEQGINQCEKAMQSITPKIEFFKFFYFDEQAIGYYMLGNDELALKLLQKSQSYLNSVASKPVYGIDNLLMQYDILQRNGKLAECDTLWTILHSYDPVHNSESSIFISSQLTILPLIRLDCQHHDYQSALHYLQTAQQDSLLSDFADNDELFHILHDIALGYVYYRCGNDSAGYYLRRVQSEVSHIGSPYYSEYLRETCAMLNILIAYRQNDFLTCRRELQDIYTLTTYYHLAAIDFVRLYSPFADDDWQQLRLIEKAPAVQGFHPLRNVFAWTKPHRKVTHPEICIGFLDLFSDFSPDTTGTAQANELSSQGMASMYAWHDYKAGIKALEKAYKIQEKNRSMGFSTQYNSYLISYGYYMLERYPAARAAIQQNVRDMENSLDGYNGYHSLRALDLAYFIEYKLGNRAACDSLFSIIAQYDPSPAARRKSTSTENSPLFTMFEDLLPRAKVYLMQSGAQAARDYIRRDHEGMTLDIESHMDLAYLFYREGNRDSLTYYLQTAQDSLAIIENPMDHHGEKISCYLLQALQDYRDGNRTRCREDFRELYDYDVSDKMSSLRFSWYYSPFLLEDWKELLRIEKELRK